MQNAEQMLDISVFRCHIQGRDTETIDKSEISNTKRIHPFVIIRAPFYKHGFTLIPAWIGN